MRGQPDMEGKQRGAGDDEQREFDEPHHAADHDRRHGIAAVLRGDLKRDLVELAGRLLRRWSPSRIDGRLRSNSGAQGRVSFMVMIRSLRPVIIGEALRNP